MLGLALPGLESVINAYLKLDPDTVARLAKLEGKTIKLEISDWNLSFYILPTQHGLELHQALSQTPDTLISGKLDALFHLGCAGSNNTALFKNRIDVEGDLHTGEEIRNILAAIDIDWEEHLSKGVGDIMANKIGNFVRAFKKSTRRTADTVELNLKEYLQCEAQALPTQNEVAQFINDTSTLRNDVERAEARLNRLLARRTSSS